jgi:hypothetical protein
MFPGLTSCSPPITRVRLRTSRGWACWASCIEALSCASTTGRWSEWLDWRKRPIKMPGGNFIDPKLVKPPSALRHLKPLASENFLPGLLGSELHPAGNRVARAAGRNAVVRFVSTSAAAWPYMVDAQLHPCVEAAPVEAAVNTRVVTSFVRSLIRFRVQVRTSDCHLIIPSPTPSLRPHRLTASCLQRFVGLASPRA